MSEAAVIDATDTETSAPIALAEAPAVPDRQLPWAGITTGKADGDLLTSGQMLERAGLNWQVGIRPLKRHLSDGRVVDAKQFEVYRLDDEDIQLGAVKSRYEILQNHEAFAFGDNLVRDGKARWAEAGMQGDGRRVFMTMKLEDTYQVLGNEPFETYLFLAGSHDGSRSVSGFITPIRVFCLNQMASVRAENVARFSVQHTSTMHDRLAEADAAIRRTGSFSEIMKSDAETLAHVQITDDKARYLLTSLIPDRRPKKDEMINGIMHQYQTSPTVGDHHGTGYGLLNGLTEYMDHVKTQRSGNARFESITFGEGAKYRLNLARKLANLN